MENVSEDEIIRQILDEKSLISLNSVKHINKDKGKRIQDSIMSYFNVVRRRISHEEYLKIVEEMEKKQSKTEISFKRRSSHFELDDI